MSFEPVGFEPAACDLSGVWRPPVAGGHSVGIRRGEGVSLAQPVKPLVIYREALELALKSAINEERQEQIQEIDRLFRRVWETKSEEDYQNLIQCMDTVTLTEEERLYVKLTAAGGPRWLELGPDLNNAPKQTKESVLSISYLVGVIDNLLTQQMGEQCNHSGIERVIILNPN